MLARLRAAWNALCDVTTVRHTEPMAGSVFVTSLRDVRDSEIAYATEADALAGTCGDDPASEVLWQAVANAHREQAVRYARLAELSEVTG